MTVSNGVGAKTRKQLLIIYPVSGWINHKKATMQPRLVPSGPERSFPNLSALLVVSSFSLHCLLSFSRIEAELIFVLSNQSLSIVTLLWSVWAKIFYEKRKKWKFHNLTFFSTFLFIQLKSTIYNSLLILHIYFEFDSKNILALFLFLSFLFYYALFFVFALSFPTFFPVTLRIGTWPFLHSWFIQILIKSHIRVHI